MKASELIKELSILIEKHGDLEVALYGDHEIATHAGFNPKSWIGGSASHEFQPAFEINGFETLDDEG